MPTDQNHVQLAGKWRILVEGDERVFAIFPCNRRGLDYLLLRMFQGEGVSKKALSYYNITVRELADNDEIIKVPEPGEP